MGKMCFGLVLVVADNGISNCDDIDQLIQQIVSTASDLRFGRRKRNHSLTVTNEL